MSIPQKRVFSFSCAKKIEIYKNDDDARLDFEGKNEDCTFIDSQLESPLICCDGVGGSQQPRLASETLTRLLVGSHYDEIDNEYLTNLYFQFLEKLASESFTASTTCLVIWPKIEVGIIHLKIFQVGDCSAYMVTDKKYIEELSVAPNCFSFVSPNEKNCPPAPMQFSNKPDSKKGFLYSPGKKARECTLVESLPFLLSQKSVSDFEHLRLVVFSDGIGDNLNLYRLCQFLLQEEGISEIFHFALENSRHQSEDFRAHPRFINKLLETVQFKFLSFEEIELFYQRYGWKTYCFSAFQSIHVQICQQNIDEQEKNKLHCSLVYLSKLLTTYKPDDLSIIAADFTLPF